MSAGKDPITVAREAIRRRSKDDPRSVAELFLAALRGNYEEDAAWDAVSVLRLRGTEDVFQTAAEYAESPDPKVRACGLDVLGQFGSGRPDSERRHLSDCTSIAVRHVADPDPKVVRSAVWALAHLKDERGINTLLALRNHPDADVRHAVAFGAGGSTRDDAIQALIELGRDMDDDVRDWATFGLGTLCENDSAEIRAALRERLDDPFANAREEAIWGLARRKDQPGLRLLLERLEGDSWEQGDEDAARETLKTARGSSPDDLCAGIRALLASSGGC